MLIKSRFLCFLSPYILHMIRHKTEWSTSAQQTDQPFAGRALNGVTLKPITLRNEGQSKELKLTTTSIPMGDKFN